MQSLRMIGHSFLKENLLLKGKKFSNSKRINYCSSNKAWKMRLTSWEAHLEIVGAREFSYWWIIVWVRHKPHPKLNNALIFWSKYIWFFEYFCDGSRCAWDSLHRWLVLASFYDFFHFLFFLLVFPLKDVSFSFICTL